MSILTGLVIVVSMAVLAQRSDSVLDFLFEEAAPRIAPQNDDATVLAGESRVIDVLANDQNAEEEDRGKVRIVVAPSCGAAEATPEGVLYLANEGCVGPQLFAYCVERGDECPTASVTVTVAANAPSGPAFASEPAEAAQAPRIAAAPEPTIVASTPAPAASGAPGATAEDAPARTAAAPSLPAASPSVGDAGAAPQIAAAAPDAAATPTVAPEAPAAPPRAPVAAAVRPVAPTPSPTPALGVGRLAAAPTVDSSGDPEEQAVAAPETIVGLADGSEPVIRHIYAAPPKFAADADKEPAALGDAIAPVDPLKIAALAEGDEWSRGDTPDVAAIQAEAPPPETPPTEVARLEPPAEEGSAIERTQEEAVQALRASPTPTPRPGGVAAPAPVVDDSDGTPTAETTAPAIVGASCDAEISSVAGAGGSSEMTIVSACRAGEPLTVLHGELAFGASFDASGVAKIDIPVMTNDGDATARFADGAELASALNFNWRELEQTLRVAVSWTAPVDIDLHAFEYAADFGGEGHVWQKQPRGFRQVRRVGGGYHANYPAVTADGESIEVYTFWANRRARRGVARIAVDLASRGERADGVFCGDGDLASPGYTVIWSERGEISAKSRGRFAAVACGETLDADMRFASGSLRELRIE